MQLYTTPSTQCHLKLTLPQPICPSSGLSKYEVLTARPQPPALDLFAVSVCVVYGEVKRVSAVSTGYS